MVCVVTVCAVSLLGASAEIKFTVPVGKLFTYEVMRETFQNDFEPLSKLYGESPNPIHRSYLNINLKVIGLQVDEVFSDIVCLEAGRLYDDPMIFRCNRQNFPDLPEWLRFTQRHSYDNGFLYGTPMSPGKSIIEVTTLSFASTLCSLIVHVCCVAAAPLAASEETPFKRNVQLSDTWW